MQLTRAFSGFLLTFAALAGSAVNAQGCSEAGRYGNTQITPSEGLVPGSVRLLPSIVAVLIPWLTSLFYLGCYYP